MMGTPVSQTAQDQLTRLPDSYTKEPGSVIHRILEIDGIDRDTLKNVLETVCSWRALNNAEGVTLDLIGTELGVERGRFTDIEYRRRLTVRIASLLSNGEINRVNEVLDALMGKAFIGLQEGWTEIAVWDYFFDGVSNFDTGVVFDAGNPCPLGPPEPAAIIIRCDLDTLYTDIQEIFKKFKVSYDFPDIITSIGDIQRVAQEVVIAGISVKWFPIIICRNDRYEIENDGNLVIIVKNIWHYFFDGGHSFNGATWFDGGYSPFYLEHTGTFKIEIPVTAGPVDRFDGAVRFNGGELFDTQREFVAHSPYLGIQIGANTSVIPAQTGQMTVVLEPNMFHFNGNLQFDGGHSFNGFISVEIQNNSNESLIHKMGTTPVSRFDMQVPFTGNLGFNGERNSIVHEVTMTEVLA